MARRLLLVALVVCLWHAPAVRAQVLTPAEYSIHIKLLMEPDTKASFEKRLTLIGAAIEREADPKNKPSSGYGVTMQSARIPASVGVPFLAQRLEHDSENVKRISVRMLGYYGAEGKAAAPAVLGMLKQDALKALRSDIVLTLAKIAPTNAENAAAILERLTAAQVDDPANKATLQALALMASVVPKDAIPRIAKFLEHRATDIGVAAYEVIGRIHALERPTLDQVQKLKEIDWRNRPDQGYAVFAVIAEAGPKAEFAVPLLLGVLDAESPAYLEYVTLDTLAKLRTAQPKAIAAVMERFTTKDFQIRQKARTLFFYFDLKKPEAVRTLAAGLGHANTATRLEIASILRTADDNGRMAPESHAEMLTPLLKVIDELDDTATPSHVDAYLGLLRRFGTRAAPAAENIVKLHQSEGFIKKHPYFETTLQNKCLAVLANIGVPESGRQLVVRALQKGPVDPQGLGYAYAAAARAAGNFLPHQDLVPLLAPGLLVPGPEPAVYFIDWSGDSPYKPTTVRLESVRALGKIGRDAQWTWPLIKEIAQGRTDTLVTLEPVMQQEARNAYLAIAGASLPPLKGVFADGKKELLQSDERLQVKMVLKLRNPRPKDMLKRLEQATKLKFTMDEEFDTDLPVTSYMYSVNVPAFQAMRQMASATNVQGAWEDTGDGYHLIARKKSPDGKIVKTKSGFPPFKDDSFDPLPDDPRLQKVLTLSISDGNVLDALKVLTSETGVTFTVEKIDTEIALSSSWQKMQAWQIMRSMGESQRVNGAWEKVGEGYLLRGTFTGRPAPLPRPAGGVQAPIGVVPETHDVPAKTPTSLFIVLAISFFILVGAASLLMVKVLRRS